MSEINLKLKTYDELTFEITRLNMDKYLLEQKLQQKENIIKEVKEYIEKNWISQKVADDYRFDYEELNIEISDIAILFDILDKEVN